MAGQRWSQLERHGSGGWARGSGLALLLPLILLWSGCGSDITAPVQDRPGSGFGTGVSGGQDPQALLLGTWRADTVIEIPGDFQALATIWTFSADSSCSQTMVTESLVEGLPATTRRACSWRVNGAKLSVTFVGGPSLTFDFSFPGPSPDVLVLDGFEYTRQR